MADVSVGRKKKDKKGRKKAAVTNVPNGDGDGSFDEDDNESIMSVASSDSQYPLDDNSEEGLDYVEDFEGKLLDSIEGTRQKGAKGRQKCLQEVLTAFRKRYLNEFVESRVDTLLDIIEKLIKRGQGQDRIFACQIACLMCIQMNEGDSTKVFDTLKPSLVTLISDDSISAAVRAEACSALGMCCFIGDVEMEDMVECLNTLKSTFSKKIPSDASQHCLFSNALSAWGLILTIASSAVVTEQILNCIGTMCKLLELGSLNLRIATGETTALVYELAYSNRVSLQGTVNTLYSLLRELANESGRHKGKREKKQQKSSFRDILKSIEDDCPPDVKVKFGAEYIQMTSWKWLRRYSAFKEALGPGTNIHLQSNPLIREIFDLGLPISKEMQETKVSKYEKQLMNSSMSKSRTQKRNMKRDNKQSSSDNF